MPAAQYDVNAWRLGHGSDTITNADGTHSPVTQGMTTTQADADRDLARRADLVKQSIINYVGQAAWDAATPGMQAAAASIVYNYNDPHRIPSVMTAFASGDPQKLATALQARANDLPRRANGVGVNAGRRNDEAAVAVGHPIPPANVPSVGTALDLGTPKTSRAHGAGTGAGGSSKGLAWLDPSKLVAADHHADAGKDGSPVPLANPVNLWTIPQEDRLTTMKQNIDKMLVPSLDYHAPPHSLTPASASSNARATSPHSLTPDSAYGTPSVGATPPHSLTPKAITATGVGIPAADGLIGGGAVTLNRPGVEHLAVPQVAPIPAVRPSILADVGLATKTANPAVVAATLGSTNPQTFQKNGQTYVVGKDYKLGSGASFTAQPGGTFKKSGNEPHVLTPVQAFIKALTPGAIDKAKAVSSSGIDVVTGVAKDLNPVASLSGFWDGLKGTVGGVIAGASKPDTSSVSPTPVPVSKGGNFTYAGGQTSQVDSKQAAPATKVAAVNTGTRTLSDTVPSASAAKTSSTVTSSQRFNDMSLLGLDKSSPPIALTSLQIAKYAAPAKIVAVQHQPATVPVSSGALAWAHVGAPPPIKPPGAVAVAAQAGIKLPTLSTWGSMAAAGPPAIIKKPLADGITFTGPDLANWLAATDPANKLAGLGAAKAGDTLVAAAAAPILRPTVVVRAQQAQPQTRVSTTSQGGGQPSPQVYNAGGYNYVKNDSGGYTNIGRTTYTPPSQSAGYRSAASSTSSLSSPG